MQRVRKAQGGCLSFKCPGCGFFHVIRVEGTGPGPLWSWNGNIENPTITPSILATYPWGDPPVQKTCHSFITDGCIRFLLDSTHHLAGLTVQLPDVSSAES